MSIKDYPLSRLADYVGAELLGNPDHVIRGIASLRSASADTVSFVADPAYQKYLAGSGAGAVILSRELAPAFPGNKLVVAQPYQAYARITRLFAPFLDADPGIHPSAILGDGASLGEGVYIGPRAVIGARAVLGAGVFVGPGAVVGEGVSIGARTRLEANATLYHSVIIGEDCLIHSGAVIGADGFGFAPDPAGWIKIHQLGRVVIGNRVEVGANATIDRGAIDDTVIADDVKIDNLVHIAHNVTIGRNTAMAALTGIAGSTRIGANCTFGGQVGIVGHLDVADGVHVSAKSLVHGSITESGAYSAATPLAPIREWRKNAVRFRQLDDMATRITALEKALKKDA